MTLLYRLDASAHEVAQRFTASAGDDPWAGGQVAPGSFAPVVTTGREFVAGPRPRGPDRAEGPTPRMIPRLWGVPPPPSAGDPRRGIASVRNLESPFWIGNLRNSEFRCLVPATSFMEWGKGVDPQGKRRQRWFVLADQAVFAFAGVWKDSEVPSFALITCQANAALRAEGRETMPVILPPDPQAWRLWLGGGWNRARALIAPYSSSLIELRG
jgi:putative SOS response-associated peptidase YedK